MIAEVAVPSYNGQHLPFVDGSYTLAARDFKRRLVQ
jgi:hypothetical protein